MQINKAKKGLRLIFVDFFGLVIGILNGFFLPMVFSIDGYALFKTFTLYTTFVSVFSFGLSNGIYLLYGGRDETKIDISKTKSYYLCLIKLQLVVCSIMLILSNFVIKDKALIFFSFIILPLQLIDFLRLYYRALGEFDKYSLIQGVLVVLELFNTLFIVLFYKSQNPDLFILIKIFNHFAVAILFSILFFNRYKTIKVARLKIKDYCDVVKPGFIVLVADMMVLLVFSLDRWFVKSLFTVQQFAYYSFAVSILNLFLVFITSITNIFYSIIAKRLADSKYIYRLKNYILIISSFSPLCYFILQYLVKTYLTKYVESLEVLWILILTLPFISVINVIYVNLYKASKNIKVYLKRIVVILAVTLILNIVVFIFVGTMSAIAWATFIVFAIWYFYSSKDFQDIKINIREVIYLAVLIVSFIFVITVKLNTFMSVFIMITVLVINVFVSYKDNALDLIKAFRYNTEA